MAYHESNASGCSPNLAVIHEPAGVFHGSEHANIARVFDLARKTAPCLLVLEDLDALVKPGNRSVFLNELDGFADNSGVCVVATTNFPERLDPSILDRPSRFDRKYTFALPGSEERRAYLEMWNKGQTTALRLSEQGLGAVIAATEGFSFAYLKELCLAATMAWINEGEGRSIDCVAAEQALALAAQMRSVPGDGESAEPEASPRKRFLEKLAGAPEDGWGKGLTARRERGSQFRSSETTAGDHE